MSQFYTIGAPQGENAQANTLDGITEKPWLPWLLLGLAVYFLAPPKQEKRRQRPLTATEHAELKSYHEEYAARKAHREQTGRTS